MADHADLYKDHPEVSGYKYLALRAPNDTWNGFYDDYVPPLIINLIRQFTLLGEVDPDKVFLIGYSHGGYGAFFIGPKIPDRFAAIHSSAAAPTDGTISPLSLRNTRFSFMVGERGQRLRPAGSCEKFNEQIEKLKEDEPGRISGGIRAAKGLRARQPARPGRAEGDAAVRATRPAPADMGADRLDHHDFFWLTVPKPEKGQSIDAALRDNAAKITTRNVKEFDLDLDGRLAALDKPLHVVLDGKEESVTPRPQLLTLCQSVLDRGDPGLAFTCRVHLVAEKKADAEAPPPGKEATRLKKLLQARLERPRRCTTYGWRNSRPGESPASRSSRRRSSCWRPSWTCATRRRIGWRSARRTSIGRPKPGELAEATHKAGKGTTADFLQADYELRDAEVLLEREKMK